ncbi:Crp/Fnr family transcriptional regulator [Bacteroidota bacterium]
MDISCASSVLDEEQLNMLSDNSYESEVKKGEVIIRSGALTSHIIYLKSGYVKEFVTNTNSRSFIIQIIKHHSYLGLHSLFGDRLNHYSYSALVDLKICYIDINTFKQFIKEKGGFAQEVLQYVCKESLNNYLHFINLSHKRINGRFADVLLYFSENIFYNTNFNILLSRQELADLMGISRENTIRALTKFKEDGIINIYGRNIEILNMDSLKIISKNG